jgi:dTDP-4-amino-4,6-dideoxygalactose transaminase
MNRIPFNKPCTVGNELEYMRRSLASGHTCGNGAFSKACCTLLQNSLSVPRALLTTSCTHALEMSALLLEIREGDEVIVPSFTFVSTANAFVLRGAKIVFADIRPDTLNLDEGQLEALITDRTRAIVVVHYAGVGCEMESILDVARRADITVVEDNAHGLFGKYRGRPLGTYGALATQSFHDTKNVTCGEGGALLINDVRYAERAEILLEKGTDRTKFFRGQVDKYSWVDIGSSYVPSDVLAAYLLAQLEAQEQIQSRRQQIWEFYNGALQDWSRKHEVRLPIIPPHCQQAYHMFYLLMPSVRRRQTLMEHLRALEIGSAFHYGPLHLTRMGSQFGQGVGSCPVTEDIADRLVRMPFFIDLSDGDLARVVDAVVHCPV